MTTGSFGPTSAVVALKKMTGSAGIAMSLSAAWSRKLRPMQTILLGRAIGGPRRTVGSTRGAEAASRAIHRSQRAQAVCREERLVVVAAERRGVDAGAVVEQHARALLAGIAEANQFHVRLIWRALRRRSGRPGR